ncbi:MAG TPA: nitroreductase [Hyphomicrobiaceae bacterium]|nr:nitroreductase [Hyphomicrobiaceae bacterium]
MDVLEAIQTRKSIRAFKSDPVDRETLARLLEIAQRAPSGTNTQPWHTYVCTGAVKDAISRDVLEMAKAGRGKSYDHYDYYPAKWNDTHNARRRAVGWGLFSLVGIQKGDREASAKQSARNFKFFDAPVGIFVTTDKYLTRGSWADAGMYFQTIMLAAKGLGLDTCPQAAWIPYQEAFRKHLGIPDDQEIISGMSLGYADPDKIENTLVSERENVANVVHYHGFD